MGVEHFGISEGKGEGVKTFMPPVVRYGYFLESIIINYKVTNSAILEKPQP